MAQSIGPNTNAPAGIISDDCVLIAGEDPSMAEDAVAHCFGSCSWRYAFRSYVFERREGVTTIYCGMGTGCIEPLLWELAESRRVRRLILAGTAGTMHRCRVAPDGAYVIDAARAAAAGLHAIGLGRVHRPRWNPHAAFPTATAVSTDFYYGFGHRVLDASHPLHATDLPRLFSEADEDLVDMEVACFYALCRRFMPEEVQFVAIKAPANPAGQGESQLANTPAALERCLRIAVDLLSHPARLS